jgi:hypothetical protein
MEFKLLPCTKSIANGCCAGYCCILRKVARKWRGSSEKFGGCFFSLVVVATESAGTVESLRAMAIGCLYVLCMG